VFVSDLRHFLDLPADAPGPARRIGEQLTLIVRAATAGDAGQPWVSALPCRRRPGRQACAGLIALIRTDVPPSIEWQCTACGDEGVIGGWEQSPFDLRAPGTGDRGTVRAVVPAKVAATLRGLTLLDTVGERLVFRATVSNDGVILAGDDEDLYDLADYVAAEGNHESNRRRQKRLDEAFDALTHALSQS
jgi:hypothetical protein